VEKRFWISVRDHGYGIDPEHLKHIFDQFWSNDLSESGKISGAGIGLSLAKEYIEFHDGKIFVESKPGEGSLFKFYLHRGKDYLKNKVVAQIEDLNGQNTVIGDYIGSLNTPEPVKHEKISVKQLIMVIEPSENLRNLINEYLSAHFQILTFKDCENMFNVISSINPRLIITNATFGNEPDGIDLCRLVKSNPLSSHIPLILISTSENTQERQEGYLYGADAYMLLPSEMEQLLTRTVNLINFSETIKRKLRQEIIVSPKVEVLQSTDDKFLAKAMEVVEQNIASDEFSIKHFSDRMNVCPSMLYRKIKNLTGLSPNDFVKDIRLTKAALLLNSKAYNVSEVGNKVGFSDSRYFSVCFKKRYGISPSGFATTKE
jgi:AraC-like DNA-binding protein